jgi:hypothetical protein
LHLVWKFRGRTFWFKIVPTTRLLDYGLKPV